MINSDNIHSRQTIMNKKSEECEPKFKYERLASDLKDIVNKDVITACAVHPKFIVFGTYAGRVHLVDHQGNSVHTQLNYDQEEYAHMVAVNEVDIDSRGEHIATCSHDGKVLILGLFTEANNQNLNFAHMVHSVSLDPDPKAADFKRFIVGHNQLVLYEKNFLKKQKCSVLSLAEDHVISMSWRGIFVAWASCIGVRVHELNKNCCVGLLKWEKPVCGQLENYRCNFCWADDRTLLIGWVNTIRVLVMRKRSFSQIALQNLPEYLADPVCTFRTNFYVSGLAHLHDDQLVVLGYPKEKTSDHKSVRPILSVISYTTNGSNESKEIIIDSLSLRGYQEYSVNDYLLRCLSDENRYYIVAPKDIVVASLLSIEDRIQWLIEHKKFEKAIELVPRINGDVENVAKMHIDYLLQCEDYDHAARVCWERLDPHNSEVWQEQAFKFLDRQQLRAISHFLPTSDDCKLDPHVYEMVLYEFLKYDGVGLRDLVSQWPNHLYNRTAIINAIRCNFRDEESQPLLETLALLYSYEKDFENALFVYMKLQHKAIFDLIRNHNLHSKIKKLIVPLLELDEQEAIKVLVDRRGLSPTVVIEQLEEHQPKYLYLFLQALEEVDNSGLYDCKMLDLLAKYDPKKLLPFLKRSQHYPMQHALDVCRSQQLHPEMVYLLSRMGNVIEALNIIVDEMKDIEMAIEFCKEHDDSDLWNRLIDESVKNPEILTKLFDGIIGYIDPEGLVNKIKPDQNIPGLQQSLFQMLWDYRLQVDIQEKCLRKRCDDYYESHAKVVRQQRRGQNVTEYDVCSVCDRLIISKDISVPQNVILVFNCGHFYHESCLNGFHGRQSDQPQCCHCAVTDNDVRMDMMDGG